MNYNKFRPFIRQALKEDIGRRDITTELLIPAGDLSAAVLLAKEDLVVCGLGLAGEVFKCYNAGIQFRPLVKDGAVVKKGKILAKIEGRTRSILTAERVALNLLGLLSGVATITRKYVSAVKPYKAKIVDTRKTLPGLRQLQKYAVRTGGGHNHRMRLDEMVLIKDNHIKGQGLKDLIERVRARAPKGAKIEIEAENLRQFRQALAGRPDIIMLDNMSISNMKKAVKLRNSVLSAKRYTLLEASGGINLKNVRQVAATGVDMISVGALTHSIKAVDVSLEAL